MALRWGVAGAGRISNDFVIAVQTCPKTDHQFVAVAANDRIRAEKFAKEHDILKSYGSYLELAEDGEVDVVYVGNLNSQHFETVKLMLNHGKHVLCEKPFTVNEKQTRRLCQISKEKKLFLMEGIWSRFFPAYKEMRRMIENGDIGEVMYVSVEFGQVWQHLERITSKEFGGGAILVLGVYMLQLQQFVFRGLKPIKIVVNGHLNKFGTDESCSTIITYPQGKMAVLTASARITLPNKGLVVGTKGTLRLPNFWCPDTLVTSNGAKTFELPKSEKSFFNKNSAGLSYEAEEVRQCIKNGKIESPQMTHQESIELAKLMDTLRKELNVVLPEDSQEF